MVYDLGGGKVREYPSIYIYIYFFFFFSENLPTKFFFGATGAQARLGPHLSESVPISMANMLVF